MSVINQMLKDLDQRQGDEPINGDNKHIAASQRQARKPWVFIFLILLLINACAFIIWWQYQENQQLKNLQPPASNTKVVSGQLVAPANESENVLSHNTKGASEAHQAEITEEKAEKPRLNNKLQTATAHHSDKPDNVQSETTQQKRITSNNQTKPINNQPTLDKATNTGNEHLVAESTTPQADISPKLSIARKQLTAQELVTQKTKAAQQAIDRSNIKQAEQLLEEILLIQPTHHSSRKQLAALWFGRQDYRAALNILSQGIALDPQYPEFRTMQARIFIKQGMLSNAIASMLPLAAVENVEFQSLLATLAQQTGDHQKAAAAYSRLTQLQPNQGKWWLGYAVALDSQGKFSLAKQAYMQTQQTNDISESTRQFIRQRLTELGE